VKVYLINTLPVAKQETDKIRTEILALGAGNSQSTSALYQ
jgi:hypothetical protein